MSSAQSTTSGDSDVMQHCVPGDVLLHLRIEFKEGREVGSVLCESRGNARVRMRPPFTPSRESPSQRDGSCRQQQCGQGTGDACDGVGGVD